MPRLCHARGQGVIWHTGWGTQAREAYPPLPRQWIMFYGDTEAPSENTAVAVERLQTQKRAGQTKGAKPTLKASVLTTQQSWQLPPAA